MKNKSCPERSGPEISSLHLAMSTAGLAVKKEKLSGLVSKAVSLKKGGQFRNGKNKTARKASKDESRK